MRTPRIAVDDPLPPRKRKKKMEKLQDRGLGRAAVCQRRTKRSVRKVFFSVGNVRINGLGVQDWASMNNGGVPLDAGEGRGDRVGRYKEDSEDGGRGVQHDRVRLAFCDINC